METLTSVYQPPATLSMAMLFKMALDRQDLKPLRAEMLARTQINPLDAAALINLCTIEQLLGDKVSGLKYQQEALRIQRLYRSSWPASSGALRVLAFVAPGDIGNNTPIDFLLQDFDVILYSLYIVPGQPIPNPLPDHDIAIVTADNSDRNHSVLEEIDRLVTQWPCRTLNRPGGISRLSRDQMYSRLKGVPGLEMPPTVRINRATLERLASGTMSQDEMPPDMAFPLIIRPVDSHAGLGLEKLDAASTLTAYLATQQETEFYLSPFIDYRSSDGAFRKYRIIWVDGHPYPCHMAIADQWKVWYYNGGMAENAAKRAEEACFMTGFDEGFGRRHARALASIAEQFGLEYMGIDCAELPNGSLLVFEGSTCLVAHDMDSPSLYPYKRPQMQKLFRSFYDMLKRKSAMVSASA